MFEKNTRKKKAYRGKHCIKSRANIKQIRCTESTHFIDLSINDKSADACVTFMHICVRYYEKFRKHEEHFNCILHIHDV